MKRSLAILLTVATALGCGDTKPRTQVTVVIDADSEVRALAESIRLEVFGGPRGGADLPRGAFPMTSRWRGRSAGRSPTRWCHAKEMRPDSFEWRRPFVDERRLVRPARSRSQESSPGSSLNAPSPSLLTSLRIASNYRRATSGTKHVVHWGPASARG